MLGVSYFNLFTSSCDWFIGLPAAVSQLLWPATAVKMTGNSKFKNDLETTTMEAYLEFMTNYFPLPPNYCLCFALNKVAIKLHIWWHLATSHKMRSGKFWLFRENSNL